MLALRTYWQGLSQRERVLLATAGGLVAALALWAALFGPLAQAVRQARITHDTAVERNALIRSQAAQIRRRSANATQPHNSNAARVDALLTQDAAEHGFTLTRNDAAGEDSSSIAISNARSAALLKWLTALEQKGIFASALSIRPNADGTVAVTATLKRMRA